MLDQISALVKEYGQKTVVENTAIPNSENSQILAEAANTITGGMQNMLAGGGLQDIISMFSGKEQSGGQTSGIAGLLKNPIVSMMIGHFINKLVSKHNVSPSQASNISNQLIPDVLANLIGRTNNYEPANDAFDFTDLIGSLTGGKTANNESSGGFDFQGLLQQLTGGGNANSGFDLQDIIQQVTSGAQKQQAERAQNNSGGLADLIKGFFN